MKQLETYEYEDMIVHHLAGHIESMYLVEYPDRMLLLDSGCKCDANSIRDYIVNKMGRGLHELKLCVVSHLHPDHAGGALSLRKHTGSRIAAFHKIDEWYAGIGGFIQHKIDTYLAWWVSRKQDQEKRRVLYSRFVKPDIKLQDMQALPGYEDWTVIHTPGHTSHDICLFHEKTGLIYAGDLFVKIKDKYLPPFPVTLPDAMCFSLKKLNKFDIKKVLLAHGGAFEDVNYSSLFKNLCEKIGKQKGLTFRLVKLGSHFSSEMRRVKKKKWDYHQ